MKYLVINLLTLLIVNTHLHAREWTDTKGRKIDAEFISQSSVTVKIRRKSDLRIFEIPISTLSNDDQTHLRELKFKTPELEELRTLTSPSKGDFLKLSKLCSEGNPYALKIATAHMDLMIEKIDTRKNMPQYLKTDELISAFFEPLGKEAANGNSEALRVLIDALNYPTIKGWAAQRGLGRGATLGSSECMDALLNYKRYNIDTGTAIFALQEAANKGNPQAVKFMADMLLAKDNHGMGEFIANNCLAEVAKNGNPVAIKAIEEHKIRSESN